MKNKILTKLQNKPRLCKTLLISKRVLDILVYLFTIVMIIMLVIGANTSPKKDEVVHTQNKPINNLMIIDNKYVLASPSDFISTTFFDGFMAVEGWAGPRIIGIQNSGYEIWYHTDKIAYTQLWTSTDFDNLVDLNVDSEEVHGFEISYTKIAEVYNNTNDKLKAYHLTMYLVGLNRVRINGLQLDFEMDIMYNSSNDYVGYDVYVNRSYNGANDLYLVFTNWGIDNNYLAKYLSGNSDNFDYAFNLGYAEGVNDIEYTSNSVFGLISQAFQAVGTIFNIDLLPGFSIGTLVFIPVVVLIIIVLFHMIKG